MREHKYAANNIKKGKLYTRLGYHGWGAYKKIILKTGLTRDEAISAEIETISLYRTFELGLNSTPGGDSFREGKDHHKAQPVNIYNNNTGEVTSFLWIGDAANFIGVSRGHIGGSANPNEHREQIFSPKYNTWFQVRRAYDNTPFVYNMPLPREKTAISHRKPIVIVNIDTHIETEFDGVDIAASKLNISQFNIHTTINRFNKQFNVGNDRYDAQYIPKTRDWNFSIIPSNKAKSLAGEKAIIAYDKDDNIIYEFVSALKAFEMTGISTSSISQCANHITNTAGNLVWEFKDPKKRDICDKLRPRKPKKN